MDGEPSPRINTGRDTIVSGIGMGQDNMADEEQQVREEDIDIDNIFQDKYNALRLKKLFSVILAEFKTNNKNYTLSEDDNTHFKILNNAQKNPLHFVENKNDNESVKKSNIMLLGQNSEDLRHFVIFQF